jgi:uncharacterized membrane protein
MSESNHHSSSDDASRYRLKSLDALRGLIIILMALDHANYFIAQRHPAGEHWGGGFPTYNSAVAFLTRFVTHLSAPGFFFLMGAGMILFTKNRFASGWTLRRIRGHLALRGVILIALQFAVVNPIWKISPIRFPVWYQGVLVALGGTMILGTLLLQARPWLLIIFTVLLSTMMEITHPDPSMWGTYNSTPLGLILGFSGGTQTFWVNYPILAWLEFVTLGMVFGHWFQDDPELASRRAFFTGAALLIAFMPVRALDGFGNIRSMQGTTWIDFLNVVKYPPSWSFTFITMGLNLVILSIFQWGEQRFRRILAFLITYGRVPLFLYIAHLLLYALLGRSFTPYGSSYGLMYLLWLVGLAILYPLAIWYARLKSAPALHPVLQYL